MTPEKKQALDALRLRAKTDLFFLAKNLLGYEKVNEETHRQLAEFFVKKDPSKPIEDQDQIKDRLLLFPRGGYKSTFDIADAVQWIICFPDVRILILCAASDLADGFVSEIAGHFTLRGKPTAFQQLFPEFCVKVNDVKAGWFTCPNRKTQWKEPTVMANSIDSNLSGWHFDIGKADDVVSNRNSETEAQIGKVIKNLNINWKMINPGGYRELIGTRYNPFDAYADALNNNTDGDLKYLHQPAWRLKPNVEENLRNGSLNPRDVQEEDCEWLLFPQGLSFKFLKKELVKNIPSFYSQYMNEPLISGAVVFTLNTLREATVPHTQIPKEGEVSCTWDFAVSIKKGSDNSAGAVTRFINNQMFVEEVVNGRFQPSELSAMVVATAQKWGTHNVNIEDAMGARFIEPEIQRKSQDFGWQININWIPTDRSEGAKRMRVHVLESLMRTSRLFFSSSMRNIDEIYEQFVVFGASKRDDMCDCIALAWKQAPKTFGTMTAQNQKSWQELRDKELTDLVFGQGRYTPQPVAPKSNSLYELADVLGGLNG